MLLHIRAPVPGDDPYDHEAVGARLGFWIAVLRLIVAMLLALVLMRLPASLASRKRHGKHRLPSRWVLCRQPGRPRGRLPSRAHAPIP